jgi:hypothetical protein
VKLIERIVTFRAKDLGKKGKIPIKAKR